MTPTHTLRAVLQAVAVAALPLAYSASAIADDLRRVTGRHIALVTDLPPDEEIDALAAAFDAAVPQWAEYFSVPPERVAGWRVEAHLVGDKATFERAGLMPGDAPRFLHGYAEGSRIWVHNQQSGYYRRCLLLHEGTHAFMLTLLGGCGPPWYMEGLAELLGAHAEVDGRLRINRIPESGELAPRWGRVKMIQTARDEGQPLRLTDVLDFTAQDFLKNTPYAWSWAAAALLDHHPRYRDRFRALAGKVAEGEGAIRLPEALGDDWPRAQEEWQVFVACMEYGYDFERMALEFDAPVRDVQGEERVAVAADRGWQNTGLRLQGGTRYEVLADGRVQLAAAPVVWWSEAGGVSIRYYQGRPLGMLLAAVRPDDAEADEPSALAAGQAIGLGGTLEPPRTGTLWLRINDSAGELRDNAGELHVTVRPASPAP